MKISEASVVRQPARYAENQRKNGISENENSESTTLTGVILSYILHSLSPCMLTICLGENNGEMKEK